MNVVKRLMVLASVSSLCLGVSASVNAEELEKQTYEIEMAAGEECVIIDNEEFAVTLVSIEPEGEWGYTWQIHLDNKSDAELMFDMADVSINGMMCDPYWATTVSAGMDSTEEIIWDSGEMEMYGIGDVTVVEFTLSAYDNNDWEAGNLVYSDYKIYPNGKDAAIAIEREPEETDQVLFETDECSMVVVGFEEDGIWGTELNVYFDNKSDKDLLISFEEVAVNGSMCDPYWGTVVTAGNNAYAAISWMEEDLEANGIERIEEVQGMMLVYDNDDWETAALVEEQISVSVMG